MALETRPSRPLLLTQAPPHTHTQPVVAAAHIPPLALHSPQPLPPPRPSPSPSTAGRMAHGHDDGDFGQLSKAQWHAAQPMDARTLIMEHIAPGLGGLVALAMFMSPLRAVLAVRANKLLGDLNPLPLVAIIANCASWILYGCIKADVYVILANEPGLMLGIFMAVSCYGFATPEVCVCVCALPTKQQRVQVDATAATS